MMLNLVRLSKAVIQYGSLNVVMFPTGVQFLQVSDRFSI